MPIVDIECVGDLPSEAGLAQSLADGLSEPLGAQPGGTWVRLRSLPLAHYAESGGGRSGAAPVFVTILRHTLPYVDAQRAEVAAVTRVVASLLGRPAERVHVLYEPAAAGRLAFAGKLVE